MITGQPLKLIGAIYDHLAVLRELEWLHKRLNDVFKVGPIELDRTITAEGSTGNKTIEKIAGTVRFAAGATTLVVTNPFVDENSLVFAVVKTNDTTAILKNVVPAAGLFTIKLNAAATAETEVGFIVFN